MFLQAWEIDFLLENIYLFLDVTDGIKNIILLDGNHPKVYNKTIWNPFKTTSSNESDTTKFEVSTWATNIQQKVVTFFLTAQNLFETSEIKRLYKFTCENDFIQLN